MRKNAFVAEASPQTHLARLGEANREGEEKELEGKSQGGGLEIRGSLPDWL